MEHTSDLRRLVPAGDLFVFIDARTAILDGANVALEERQQVVGRKLPGGELTVSDIVWLKAQSQRVDRQKDSARPYELQECHPLQGNR